MISTKQRNTAYEIMDDFELEGEELREALDKIAKINQLLGGNQLTIAGLKQLLKNHDKNKTITILDVGCGNGDMLRYVADFGQKEGYHFRLLGIDANEFTIQYAKKISIAYPSISYLRQDIFQPSFKDVDFDIVLCTLTLHHFTNPEIEYLIDHFYEKATIGFVINDLHRSALAYRLFQALCWVFRLNRMSKEDGLLSILKGFKKEELTDFSNKIKAKKQNIQWKWAFRYQWIASK